MLQHRGAAAGSAAAQGAGTPDERQTAACDARGPDRRRVEGRHGILGIMHQLQSRINFLERQGGPEAAARAQALQKKLNSYEDDML